MSSSVVVHALATLANHVQNPESASHLELQVRNRSQTTRDPKSLVKTSCLPVPPLPILWRGTGLAYRPLPLQAFLP